MGSFWDRRSKMRALAATGVEAENIFQDFLVAAVDDGETLAAEGEPQLPG